MFRHSSNASETWKRLPWKQLRKNLFRLQQRVYKAIRAGDKRKAQSLQRLILKSTAARLLAVRQVTQLNQGKKTAGIDGKASLTFEERLELNETLQSHASNWFHQGLREIPIPKKDGKTRILKVPTMYDRALQALVKLALEPEWEARFEPNSYGFRPGRSCQDAVEAIFLAIKQKPKYVLDADIAKCFDRINHEVLLNKLNTFPTIRRQVRAWLKSGVMDNKQLFPISEGTPQGGVISPLLANIALQGMEERIKQYAETLPTRRGWGKRENRNSLSLIRYADDFVILHEDITVVQRCRELIAEWLNGMGLELKPSKTRLAHTLNRYEQEKPGFDFLGFTIQQFPIGKYHSKQGFKTIITPSKQKQKVHYDHIASVIEAHKAAPQAALISRLNPIIKGWANYYATVVSKKAYAELDHLMYQKLKAWAKRRHPNKNERWVSKKYWQSIGGNNWVFATRKEGSNPLRVLNHVNTPIVRHEKVKGESSPYDGNLCYWSTRMGNNPEMPSRVSKLLKRQKGKCAHCGRFFRENDVMEVDHRIPKSKGGKDSYDNWQLLHRHCHDTKTATDIAKAKAEEMEIIERFERAKAIANAYAQGTNPELRQYVDVPGNKSGCNSTEPKPTRRLEKVEDKWVMRYA